MKKNIKYILLLILFLIPVISVKADYGCYYMCADSSCNEKMVLYTDRDVVNDNAVIVDNPRVITPTNGQPLDLFEDFGDYGNIQAIYDRFDNFNPVSDHVLVRGSASQSFKNYTPGTAMSESICREAATIAYNFFDDQVQFYVAENHNDPSELPQDVFNVFSSVNYNISDALILYGSDGGFKVLYADNSDADGLDPLDPFGVSDDRELTKNDFTYLITSQSNWAAVLDEIYPPGSGARPDACNNVESEEQMLECLGCDTTTAKVDQACTTGVYTIGILLEPETVTNAIETAVETAETALHVGHATGTTNANASSLTWTCDDVKYTTAVYNILRLIAPFLLIIFASLDYFKAVVAGDIKKQQEAKVKAPKRLIAFLLLLVIPFIVSWMFKSFGGYGSNVMTAFCCVATNGNQNCSIGSSNSGTPTTPTNTSQVDEVTADNLCNGNNYLSPNKITTVCSVKDCINNRYGECLSTNLDDGICNKCEYTPLSISEELCTSNCGVGYKSGQCFFNVVKGVSTSSINNLANSGLSLIKKVHQAGTTGDYQDGYFNYDRKIKENVTQTVCTNELNGTPYDCDSSGNSCSCLYGNSIISSN